MNKKILFMLSLVFLLGLSVAVYASGNNDSVPDEVMEIAEKNLSNASAFLVKEYEVDQSAKVSIGDVHRIYYLKDGFESMRSTSLADAIFQSDDYLFVLQANGHPISYMQIGKQDGKYQLQMYGGNAEYIDIVKENLNKLNPKKVYMIALGPNYSFLTSKGELIAVPNSINEKDKADKVEDANKLLSDAKEQVKQDKERINNNEMMYY